MLARARARAARVDILMLTVDSITGGNRERDKRSGFGIAFRLKPAALLDFALKPRWTLNSLCGKKLTLPQLDAHADLGGTTMSISRYFSEMRDPQLNWTDVAQMVNDWGGKSCLKDVMPPKTPSRPPKSAASPSSCPTIPVARLTAPAPPSTNWPRWRVPSVTASSP